MPALMNYNVKTAIESPPQDITIRTIRNTTTVCLSFKIYNSSKLCEINTGTTNTSDRCCTQTKNPTDCCILLYITMYTYSINGTTYHRCITGTITVELHYYVTLLKIMVYSYSHYNAVVYFCISVFFIPCINLCSVLYVYPD